MSQQSLLTAAYALRLTRNAENPGLYFPVDVATTLDLASANSIYFPKRPGTLTPANIRTVQVAGSQIVAVEAAANNTFGGSSVATAVWKLTAIIGAGIYGKSTSVIWAPATPQVINTAYAKSQEWYNILSNCMGNKGVNNVLDTTISEGSPAVEYVRITDAAVPRVGQLFGPEQLTQSQFGKPASAATPLGQNAADFASTALALRIPCVTPTTPAITVYSNHGFFGVPDLCVINGNQISLNALVGDFSEAVILQIYLNYITAGANFFGCVTIPATELPFAITAWASTPVAPAVSTAWTFTAPTANFGVGDRIRITGTNNSFFNGSYKISAVAGNVYTIVNGPPTSLLPVPSNGFARRYYTKAAGRLIQFAQFQSPLTGWVPNFGLKVSKRNPAKRFVAVSFRKRKRRPH